MTDFSREEFAALRATIRQRGTARVWMFLCSTCVWGALSVALAVMGSAPLFTLLPLVVLAAGFEAVFNVHVGVERIGRYLQAFAEESTDAGARWETTAMAFGRGFKPVASDPLFSVIYVTAAFLNAFPALGQQPIAAELVVVAGAHLLFAARVLVARRAAAGQRAADLERFRALKP